MATPSILPPQQTKQPSRKGKKAWRKNVDISEVQSGLEEVREQITKTGGVIAEKPDTALFSLDLKPDTGSAEKHLGRQSRKLRADEILAERSAIPAVDTHNRKRPSGAAVGTGVTKKVKHKKDWVANKEVARLRKLAFNTQDIARPGRTAELGRVEYDPWAMDEDSQEGEEEEGKKKLDFLEEKKEIRAPESMRHPPVALAEVGEVPAVRKPEAGISYNPEFAKWDELLRNEGEKAVEEEKKRLAKEAEELRIKELTKVEEGMQVAEDEEDEDENEDEKDDDDEEEAAEEEPKKPIETKRKTQAQRNKEARKKAAEQALAQKKILAKQNRELLLIRKYARTVDARNRARAEKSKEIVDDLENPKVMRRKRLGMVPLSKAPLELQLPDELSESLRRLKPEGNLLRDRFRSLQERGKVETRAPVVHARKVKRKSTEKWSYKDFK